MKHLFNTIFVTIIIFCAIPSFGQKYVVGDTGVDSTKVITHDETGSGHRNPLDIPDDFGLFIYANEGNKALRIYGSFRMLFVLDEKQQFQPFEIDPPKLPTGDDDFKNYNATWTPDMSRLGFDALWRNEKGNGFLIRFELDWKGTSEKFRIRHLFMRTPHWVIGQTWTSFAGFPYLPQTVAGHMTGATSGQRTPQIRYYNTVNNWKYQIGVEYKTASLIMPDTLDAVSRIIIPALVGRFSYGGDWGQVGMAALVKPNRVQFTGDDKDTQSLIGYGGNVGAKFNMGKANRIKLMGYCGSGMGSYIADYTFTEIELIYNSQTTEFENIDIYGGLFAYEHDWNKLFSSTFAGGYNFAKNKSYQEDLAFNYSYKVMVNLFYKPIKYLKGLVVGAEVLYAERFNKNNTSNKALRASLLMYYDF